MLYKRFDCGEIYRNFAEKGFDDFAGWQEHARKATVDLIAWHAAHPVRQQGGPLPVKSEIYGTLKKYLIGYFYGKCAYCESEFASVAWGDVEHYRPKRGVTGEDHPGYFWLAYEPRNLLPSCQKCNQGSGKRNYFPVSGVRAERPEDDLAAELPLLLNPYEEIDCGETSHHIRCVFEEDLQDRWNLLVTGRVEGVGARGQASVGIYDLNRPALVRQRQKNQAAAINKLKLALISPEKLETEFRELLDPKQEHSSSVHAACEAWYRNYMKKLDESSPFKDRAQVS